MALANAEFINLQARELLQERQQYHQEVCCASIFGKTNPEWIEPMARRLYRLGMGSSRCGRNENNED
jgi:hypothetical protein